MPSVTIDAGVLAAPPEYDFPDEVHRYVETLLDWSKLLDEPWVAIRMSEKASESLFADDLFPLRERLQRVFTASRIVEYDANTVAVVVERLLQLTPSFETYFSIRDVLHEELTTEPDILRLCSGSELQSDLARCVVLIAILRQHCQLIDEHSLILRRAPSRIVRIRALIHELEHQRDDFNQIPVPPDYFEGDVLVCDDFKGLVECLDEAAILLRSTDNVGIETAIRTAIYKSRLDQGTSPDWDDLPSFRIGHSFWSRLVAIHLEEKLAIRLLRAMVECLEQSSMAATHWLRTGPGGDDSQRVRARDTAKAWRRDIDHEHHLHYWECEDGLIEFAWVSFPHDDFMIPE